MKRVVTSLFALAITIGASAQKESKLLEIKAASWQFGLYIGEAGVSNFSDFQQLAPKMTLTENDLIGFSNSNGYIENAGFSFSANIILAKPSSENTPLFNPEFRFGVSFQQADVLNQTYHRRDEYRVDTLQSSRSGEEFYVDSIQNQQYSLSYVQQQVMLDGDVIISTDPQKRWKFYAGVGLSLGLSVSPRTEIASISYSYIDGRGNEIEDLDYQNEGNLERYSNKGGFFGRVYLPLGIDFTLGKRKESLKKYHLFVESRQSLNFQSVPELSPMTTLSSSGGIGLRYNF